MCIGGRNVIFIPIQCWGDSGRGVSDSGRR